MSPLPEVKVTTDRPQIVEVGNALVCQLLLQVLVLHAQKRFVCHFRHTDIHQRAQQLALLPRVPRHVQALVFRFSFNSDRIRYSRRSACVMFCSFLRTSYLLGKKKPTVMSR